MFIRCNGHVWLPKVPWYLELPIYQGFLPEKAENVRRKGINDNIFFGFHPQKVIVQGCVTVCSAFSSGANGSNLLVDYPKFQFIIIFPIMQQTYQININESIGPQSIQYFQLCKKNQSIGPQKLFNNPSSYFSIFFPFHVL